MMATHWMRVALAATLLAASGCSSDTLLPLSRITFSDVSSMPEGTEVSDGSITLTEGTAISAKVTAIDSEGHEMGKLNLESQDSSIIAVEPSVAENVFIFVGVAEGSTEIDLVIVGERQGRITAEVLAQDE